MRAAAAARTLSGATSLLAVVAFRWPELQLGLAGARRPLTSGFDYAVRARPGDYGRCGCDRWTTGTEGAGASAAAALACVAEEAANSISLRMGLMLRTAPGSECSQAAPGQPEDHDARDRRRPVPEWPWGAHELGVPPPGPAGPWAASSDCGLLLRAWERPGPGRRRRGPCQRSDPTCAAEAASAAAGYSIAESTSPAGPPRRLGVRPGWDSHEGQSRPAPRNGGSSALRREAPC